MCVRERRCTVLHEESGKLRTDPFRGEASIKRINHATITITRHTLQFHSHTSQEQDHPFAPPICLLQTRFLARRHTMIVPHRHTANPITLASLIAQGLHLLNPWRRPVSITQQPQAPPPRPLPATSLYAQSTYQRCTSQAAHHCRRPRRARRVCRRHFCGGPWSRSSTGRSPP